MEIFISYSRVNKDFALKLAKELRVSDFPIWFDQLDIPTGVRWDDEVQKALERSEIFMIIMTPASITSENVKDEIGYAIDQKKHILPIMLESCDVPLRLRRFQYVDFTTINYNEGIENSKKLLKNIIEQKTEASLNVKTETSVIKTKKSSKVKINKKMIVVLAIILLLIGVGIILKSTIFNNNKKISSMFQKTDELKVNATPIMGTINYTGNPLKIGNPISMQEGKTLNVMKESLVDILFTNTENYFEVKLKPNTSCHYQKKEKVYTLYIHNGKGIFTIKKIKDYSLKVVTPDSIFRIPEKQSGKVEFEIDVKEGIQTQLNFVQGNIFAKSSGVEQIKESFSETELKELVSEDSLAELEQEQAITKPDKYTYSKKDRDKQLAQINLSTEKLEKLKENKGKKRTEKEKTIITQAKTKIQEKPKLRFVPKIEKLSYSEAERIKNEADQTIDIDPQELYGKTDEEIRELIRKKNYANKDKIFARMKAVREMGYHQVVELPNGKVHEGLFYDDPKKPGWAIVETLEKPVRIPKEGIIVSPPKSGR